MDIIVTFTSYFNYCLVYKISKKIPKTDKKISWYFITEILKYKTHNILENKIYSEEQNEI